MKRIAQFMGAPAAPAEYIPGCPTCGGSGVKYTDFMIGDFRSWRTEPCPDCASPTCAVCDDQGMVTYRLPPDHPYFGQMFPCPVCEKGARLEREAAARALRNAELPAHYASLTFATWDALADEARSGKMLARHAVALWAACEGFSVRLGDAYAAAGYRFDGDDTPRTSLVLWGGLGQGKTGLAAAAVNALAAQRRRCLYIRVQDLLTSLKAAFDRSKRDEGDYESPEEILDRVKKSPALVLDEMSTNQPTPWRLDQMEELIRYRYGNGMPTLITTNHDRDGVEREWGMRTASPLFAMAHWIEMTGQSLRQSSPRVGGW